MAQGTCWPLLKIVRWLFKLSEFDFDIKHRTGKKNANANALSGLPPKASTPLDSVMDRPLLPDKYFVATRWFLMEEYGDSPPRVGYINFRQQGQSLRLERGIQQVIAPPRQ